MVNLHCKIIRKETLQTHTSTRLGLARIIQRFHATESDEFLMFFHPSLRFDAMSRNCVTASAPLREWRARIES
jgi:hypothetical protein